MIFVRCLGLEPYLKNYLYPLTDINIKNATSNLLLAFNLAHHFYYYATNMCIVHFIMTTTLLTMRLETPYILKNPVLVV